MDGLDRFELNQEKHRPDLVRKIGNMTYVVRVYFKEDAREDMSEKIKRLLREEVRQMGKEE